MSVFVSVFVCVFVVQRVEEYSFCVAHKFYSAEASRGGRGQRKWTCGFIWFIAKLLLFDTN